MNILFLVLRLTSVIGNNEGNIHLLGTDNMGRDILSRMFVGTQITMLFALLAVSASLVIGLMVGISSDILEERMI